RMQRRDVLKFALSSTFTALAAGLAFGQGRYPEQPIRFVVPRSAGGVVDVVARLWAEQVKPQLGNVVIENQGGGGGIIAASVVASAHLCGELFKQIAGLPDIVHVPYKGANPGLADFYSGHLPMLAASISPQVLEMHRQGKIRILVAGSNRRLEAAPEIPTNVEAGFPDLVTVMFMGVFAPSATPRPIVEQIADVTHQVMADSGFQKKLIG